MTTNEHELILHFIRSPLGIDWRSPRKLLVSAILNIIWGSSLRPGHAIGHVNIELSDRRNEVKIWTGITVDDRRSFRNVLLKDKIGFGILFYRFKARLETASEIQKNIESARRQKRLESLRFIISPEAYVRLEKYFVETRQMGSRLGYGFPLDPRKREGAGCSAYAMSFIEIAGLFEPAFLAWKQSISVPNYLAFEGQQPISVFKIIKTRHFWGGAPLARVLHFWDPDLMYKWVKTTRGSAAEVIIDSHQKPTPKESIWIEA